MGKVTAYAALDPERGLENRLGDDTGMCNYAINHPDNNLFDINGHGKCACLGFYFVKSNQMYSNQTLVHITTYIRGDLQQVAGVSLICVCPCTWM